MDKFIFKQLFVFTNLLVKYLFCVFASIPNVKYGTLVVDQHMLVNCSGLNGSKS